MLEMDEKDVNVFLNLFYSYYFVDYFEEVLSDQDNELSVVTLFRGRDYFLEICKKYSIHFPYSDKKEYVEKNYEDGAMLFSELEQRYKEEWAYYQDKEVSFVESNCKLAFH